MSTFSTALTGTIDLSEKTLTFASKIAAYESRSVSLSISGGDFPTGNYKLQIHFGPRVIALAALSASGATLTGTISLSTTQIEALFDVLPVQRFQAVAILWDVQGKVLYARSAVDVWRNEYSDNSPDTSTVQNTVIQGVQNITDGASSVTVSLTGYTIGATASPAGFVLVPEGSDNIFVVGVRITSTEAVFMLSSPAGSGYKLSWMVAQ